MASRRGIALFAALGMIAIVGLLIGATVASTTLAQRSASATHVDARLNAAPDFAIGWLIEQQHATGLADQPLGEPVVFSGVPTGTDGFVATVAATRLPGGVLWLVGEATTNAAWLGRRRVNLIARWRQIGRVPPAGIVARGNVRIAAGVVVAANTTGDAECRVPPNSSQIALPTGATVTSPDSLLVSIDSAARDSTLYLLSARQRTALDSFRVVRVTHDTTLSSGRFDGLVLVDGALVIDGPVTATGLIVARGPIDVRAGNLTVSGAIMSFAAPASGYAIDIASGSIRYAPCAVARALRRAVPLRPVNARSWSELF